METWKNEKIGLKLDLATERELKSGESLDNLTWLTTEEAAIHLRKTPNALRILVNRGHLRARKFRRRLYFRRIELDRLLESSIF